MNIIIGGHSYLCLFAAKRPQSIPSTYWKAPLTGTRHLHALHGPWPRDPGYWQACLDATENGRVALIWKGNQHNLEFLIRRDPALDFHSSSLTALPVDPDARLLSELEFRQFLAPSLRGLRQILANARSLDRHRRIIILGTPPPIGDNAWLAQRIRAHPRWSGNVGSGFGPEHLTVAWLRLKLWDLLQRMMAELAQEHECLYCPAPAEGADAQGFLQRRYWGRDVTHPNTDYGDLLVAALSKMGPA